MKHFKITVSSIIFCLLLVCTQSFEQTSCKDCNTGSCSTVTFNATYQGKLIYSNTKIPWVKGMNVTVAISSGATSIPLSVQTTPYCPHGSFVDAINGNKAQQGYYWAIYINGIYGNFGIDFQQLNAGDVVLYDYTSYTTVMQKSGTANLQQRENLSASTAKAKLSTLTSKQTLYFMHQESLRKK